MSQRKIPGLQKVGNHWHIDKVYKGQRLHESTGTSSLEKAQENLAKRLEELRQAVIFGVRPKRTFSEAAAKYLNENLHKRSIEDSAMRLRKLDQFIGSKFLNEIYNETLLEFKNVRLQEDKVKKKTVNLALQTVRQILNLAANEWRDENGLTWLDQAPKIKMLKVDDAAKPYPLKWAEQGRLFHLLPTHLETMCLFKINTGCREQEVCNLQWSWEYEVPELKTTVFIIPGHVAKNGQERLIVLNDVAKASVESQRGMHDTHVFCYRGNPISNMRTHAWRKAWINSGLPTDGSYLKGVHNLRHTFATRLRAARVSYEDRQDLLGHANGNVTTHYSAPEIGNLIDAVNTVKEKTRELTLLRKVN
ncbi:MAG: tyrosine-type recombinase/integrase [Pseudomonadales bacterium]|nr:tyrosine-type recombinase/integrase [Pseudomonadales bacterium]